MDWRLSRCFEMDDKQLPMFRFRWPMQEGHWHVTSHQRNEMTQTCSIEWISTTVRRRRRSRRRRRWRRWGRKRRPSNQDYSFVLRHRLDSLSFSLSLSPPFSHTHSLSLSFSHIKLPLFHQYHFSFSLSFFHCSLSFFLSFLLSFNLSLIFNSPLSSSVSFTSFILHEVKR